MTDTRSPGFAPRRARRGGASISHGLAEVINDMEESPKDSDFSKQGLPTTGCRHLWP